VRLARQGRPGLAASVAAGTLVALVPVLQLTTFYVFRGYLPIHNADPNSSRLLSAVQLLEARGVRGVYSDYWTSYPVTFLSGERIRAAPLDEWDRSPGDAEFVGALPEVAYLFPFQRRDEIRARLSSVPRARAPVEIPFLPWVMFLDVSRPRPEPASTAAAR
jgi:hypothetical protein